MSARAAQRVRERGDVLDVGAFGDAQHGAADRNLDVAGHHRQGPRRFDPNDADVGVARVAPDLSAPPAKRRLADLVAPSDVGDRRAALELGDELLPIGTGVALHAREFAR